MVAPHLIIFHVPNGGYRDQREAAKLKWIGVVAGVHDLIVIDDCGLVYLLEVKAPDGVLSADQIKFHGRCRSMNVPQAIVTTIDDARAAFKRWGLKTREVY